MHRIAIALLFFWISSFICAAVGYGLLLSVASDSRVFGDLFRLLPYHHNHPLAYIAIPCFFYGISATITHQFFVRTSTSKVPVIRQLLLTGIMIFTIVLLSMPFGGMLWYYHDMQAGRFPNHWLTIMTIQGAKSGIRFGWLVIAKSLPYNLIGIVICFFLTKGGGTLLFNFLKRIETIERNSTQQL